MPRALAFPLLFLIKCVLVAATAPSGSVIDSRWRIAGPFPIGKTEVDALPLPWRDLVKLMNSTRIGSSKASPVPIQHASELLPEGIVRISSALAAADGEVKYAPQVDWNGLVQTLSAMEVLEFQAFAWVRIRSPSPRSARLHCVGVVAAHLIGADGAVHTYAGDIYGTGRIASIVDINATTSYLAVFVRGKAQASWSCTASPPPAAPIQILQVLSAPDVLEGRLLGESLALSVALNGAKPLRGLVCAVWSAAGEELSLASTDVKHPLATQSIDERQMLILPCPLRVGASVPGCKRDGEVTIRVRVVEGGSGDGSGTSWVQHRLRCRAMDQSALFSFVDHDGSAQTAAVIAPLSLLAPMPSVVQRVDATHGWPVLLTLHGTGVSASSQADAHKVMPTGKKDYEFGVSGYWTLAPSRHGAHNWQGVGLWHAWTALQRLAALVFAISSQATQQGTQPSCTSCRQSWACVPQVDTLRVLFAGHSMGGAGAWQLATAFSDVAIAAAPLASWLNKEAYGDANAFMRLDATEPFVDPALKGVLLASVHDQRSDVHLDNLQGVPVYLRVGAVDPTTPPYYTRRALRLLRTVSAGFAPEQNASSLYVEEVPKQGHWWWDTRVSNDGGVVNDEHMRSFYAAHRKRVSSAAAWRAVVVDQLNQLHEVHHTLPSSFVLSSTNPHVQALGRSGLFVQAALVGQRRAAVTVRLLDHPLAWWTMRVWHIATSNVRVLRIGFVSEEQPVPRPLAERIRLGAHDLHSVCYTAAELYPQTAANATTPSFPFVLPAGFCVDDQPFALMSLGYTYLCRESATSAWSVCPDDHANTAVAADGALVNPRPIAPSWHAAPGPMRAVAAAPFVIVSSATRWASNYARLLSLLHASAFDTFAPVVHAANLINDSRNAILVGVEAWQAVCSGARCSPALTWHATASPERWCLGLGSRPICAVDLAVVARIVSSTGANLLVVLADTPAAWRALSRASLPTIPPMVRAPFSNLWPDVVAMRAEPTETFGLGGVLVAGFWNANLTGLDPFASFAG